MDFCPYCMRALRDGRACSGCDQVPDTYVALVHHLPPGTVLAARYLVGRVLGEGGFGVTYIGLDLERDTRVAIKEFFPKSISTRMTNVSKDIAVYAGASEAAFRRGKEHYLRETRAIAALVHNETAVDVLDSFEENNTAYIVMEYVEGMTLLELCEAEGGRLEVGRCLQLLEPVFWALQSLHEVGLIHRDVSPDNLMLQEGRVRLIDFGCVREGVRGTRSLTVMLKDGYAPIEQYTRRGQGPWTDVYGLGATIYQCVTGVRPPSALERQIEDELQPPTVLGCAMTGRQEHALVRSLCIRPARRYQTMAQFHHALYERAEHDMNHGVLHELMA